MKMERKNPMKRSSKPASGQFTLTLHREPSPPLDETRKDELLKVLAEVLLEALGVASTESPSGKEPSDESKDHA
jgi:hypothetical protein